MSDCIAGLDLGQAADYSALVVLERAILATSAFGSVRRAVPVARYACRALRRWPLGTSYPDIVAEVVDWASAPRAQRATLVVDATGVGRAVVDLLRRQGLSARLAPVTVTAGRRVRLRGGFLSVPKGHLIGALRQVLGQRRLQFSAGLPEAQALLLELQNHRVRVSATLRETFGAAGRTHDDLLSALMLAVWWGERQQSATPSVKMSSCSQGGLAWCGVVP